MAKNSRKHLKKDLKNNHAYRTSFVKENEVSILTIILVVLVYILWQVKDYQILPSWDGTFYINYSIDSVFPPGYPLFIMVAKMLTSSGVLAGRAVSMFFLILTVIVVYMLAKSYSTPALAMAAAIFTGFAPISLRIGTETLSEATYTFFVLASAYFYSLAIGKGLKKIFLFLAGASAAIAFYTRPEVVVFLFFLILFEIYKFRKAGRAMILIAGFAAVFIPAATGIYLATGKIVLTRKTMNFRVLDPMNWVKNEQLLNSGNADHPGLIELLKSTVINYPVNLWQETKYLFLFAGVPAVALSIWRIVKKRDFLISGLVEFFVYPVFTFLALPQRFVYPYIPFLAILSIAAIHEFVPNKVKGVAVILLIAGTITGYSFLTTPSDPFPELEVAGYALKPFVNQKSLVLDRKPYTTFFAGLTPEKNFLPIPLGSIERVIQYAHDVKAEFLVLDRRVVYIFRPELASLFDPEVREKYSSSLQVLTDLYPGTEFEVLLLRIK